MRQSNRDFRGCLNRSLFEGVEAARFGNLEKRKAESMLAFYQAAKVLILLLWLGAPLTGQAGGHYNVIQESQNAGGGRLSGGHYTIESSLGEIGGAGQSPATHRAFFQGYAWQINEAPYPITQAASDIAGTTAKLNGLVNPNTQSSTAFFEYGLTTAYGLTTSPQTLGYGGVFLPINSPVTGLQLNQNYHFRVVASNLDGLVRGADQTFNTGNNTPAGNNVAVQPVDTTTGTTPAAVAFAQVTQAGTTALTTSGSGSPPPTGFQVGTPARYYEITTTASYLGAIQICLNYTGINYVNEAGLKLFHFENGAWVDVTSSLDTINKLIYGAVTSLSPFAIFESTQKTPVITWANPASISYGTPLSGTQLNATANTPGSFTYTPPAGTVLPAGNGQKLTVTFNPTDTTLYRSTTATVLIEVGKATLTITAEDKAKVAGGAMPALTAKYAGFVNGDGASSLIPAPVLSTIANASSPAGSYPITVSGAGSDNYSILYIGGTLTVMPASLSLVISPQTVRQSTLMTVTFQLYVPPDINFIPSSPNIQRQTGSTWSVVAARMYDDGSNGDAIPNDNIYTIQLDLKEPASGPIVFRCSVAYKGQILRKFSNTCVLTVGASSGLTGLGIRINHDGASGSQLAAHSAAKTIAGEGRAQAEPTGQFVTIMVPTVAGKNCVLECTDSLIEPKWMPVLRVEGDGEVKSYRDSVSASQRFYRVRDE